MKTVNLLKMFLIGLGISANASAQNDLDYVNNTPCSFSVTIRFEDGSGNCNPCHGGAMNISAFATGTITTCTGGGGQAYSAHVVDACSNYVLVEDQASTNCYAPTNLSANLPACGSCSSGVSVTFTPATSTSNAILTIN